MNQNSSIYNIVKKYDSQIFVILLFFWIWYLCFPYLPAPDPYGLPSNQWGISTYILFNSIYEPLEQVMQSKFGECLDEICFSVIDDQIVNNGPRILVYHLGACLVTLFHSILFIYSLITIINSIKTHFSRHQLSIIIIALLIPTLCYLPFVKNTDLFFCSSSMFIISILFKTYLDHKHINSSTFFFLIIFTSFIIGYRRNAIIIFPIFIGMFLLLYNKTYLISKVKLFSYSILITIIFALPFSTSLLMPILHINDAYGEEVFMSSDYACMRMLKGKSIDLNNINGIKQDDKYLFMQHYERFGTCNDMKGKWIKEIKQSPLIFIEARTINYLQFISLGCLPNCIIHFINARHPDIYLPNSNDFCTIVDLINNPKQRFELSNHNIHPLSDFGNIRALFKRSLFNYDLYFKWSYHVAIILIAYSISLIFFIYILFLLIKHTPLSFLHKWILFLGELEFGYLLSFLVFTPTPDFRYHFFSITMSFLIISLFICDIVNFKRERVY